MKKRIVHDKYFSFLELTKARKTTYEFSKRKVTEVNLMKIIDAGRWSPSCSNIQPWHFIIVKKKEKIRKLIMTANYGDFHKDPSLVIALVLLRDYCPGKHFSCFQGKDKDIRDAFLCIGMLGLNMVLEARELGIDSCILTPHEKDVKKILKVPDRDSVPIILGFGYQSRKAYQKVRERRERSSLISREHFGEK